jgi:glyoxylase-like metal-dependent hydrolase (beta-lactamase superfamily II)
MGIDKDGGMRVKQPGRVLENLWFLGCENSSIYLLIGKDESVLINGGVAALVPDLLEQFEAFGINASQITAMLILHSHFDHVGILPYLKRKYPQITVYASSQACRIFRKPKAIAAINHANQYVIGAWGMTERCRSFDLAWRDDIACEAVGEGDRIDLGDMEVLIYDTPGHSPCSISAYVPKLRLLFPSEAGGLPFKNKIAAYGTSNFSDFEKSIQKLSQLPVSYFCSDHYGCVVGDEAYGFLSASIDEIAWRRQLMVAAYRRTGSIEAAGSEMAELFRDENAAKLIPWDLFVAAHRHMVKRVVENMASLED